MTLPAMGAEPVTISLHRPPRMALVFLKTRRSQSQCVYLRRQVTCKLDAKVDAGALRAPGAATTRGLALALGQPGDFGGDGLAHEPRLTALQGRGGGGGQVSSSSAGWSKSGGV